MKVPFFVGAGRWSLLDKEHHPVSHLHHHLTARLSHAFPSLCVLPDNHPALPRVLAGYRSSLLLHPRHGADAGMDTDDVGERTGGEDEPMPDTAGTRDRDEPTGKELKDLKNLEKASAGAGLQGGKVSCGGGSPADRDPEKRSQQSADGDPRNSPPAKSFQHSMDREGAPGRDGGSAGSSETRRKPAADVFLPFASPVFVVHRTSRSQKPESRDSLERGLSGEAAKGSDERGVDSECGETAGAEEMDGIAGGAASGMSPMSDSSVNAAEKDETPGSAQSPPADSLFHLRCSLLENLAHLDSFMRGKSSKAVLMSGIVFRQCSVSPVELPVSHETVVVAESDHQSVDDLANQLCVALRVVVGETAAVTVKAKRSHSHFTVGDKSRISVALTLQAEGAQKCVTLGEVFRFETDDRAASTVDRQAEESGELCRTLVGAVLYLDNIACLALRLPDVRLLWSEDERFTGQFSSSGSGSDPRSFLPTYRPISLYPVRCVHDLSFWESPERVFDEADFLAVVREVADDAVTGVWLLDRFESGDLGKTSRCYRLVFQSHDRALSYIASWKLQSVVRLTVAQRMGVTLR